MKTYIQSPSLTGLITHDYLSYEGIKKDQSVYMVMDGALRFDNDNSKIIQDYYYDLYSLFMKKLTQFANASELDKSESTRLQALLQELIKVKEILTKKPE